jgi:peptide/nickel transport system permease protein
MFIYIVKRLLISIVVLLGVSIIIYSLVRMMPNNYLDIKFASKLQSGDMTLEQLEAFKVQYGISDNSFSGIVSGYFKWLGNMLKGDLGTSFKYELPVAEVIGSNMWVSFAIAVIATILQFAIAIPLGITSATHQYSKRDYAVTVFTMIGIALPTYFFAAIIVKVFSVQLGWFPSSGLISAGKVYTDDLSGFVSKLLDMGHHLVLPIACTVILSLGGLMRYTRTNTLEVLNADYIRTARAKGLPEKQVIYKHAFRNTMIPLVTLLAGILPSLFGGMMITEEVFAINGIGRLAYKALSEGDIPFVMGYNMFLAILTVIGTLLSDIMYSVVDPRVKLGK